MPTYHYACRSCERVHEIFHAMSEEPRRKCPDCGGRLDRQIGTGGGVLLKGSGFYTTDYRSDGYHKEAKRDREAASGGKKDKKEKNEKKSSAGDTSGSAGKSSD